MKYHFLIRISSVVLSVLFCTMGIIGLIGKFIFHEDVGEWLYAFIPAMCFAYVLRFVKSEINQANGRLCRIGVRECSLAVVVSWLLVVICGGIPYLEIFKWDVINAFFESMSGFTTTGATVMTEKLLNNASHTILLWRAQTQWVGGLGVIMFIAVLVPLLAENGDAIFNIEMTGIQTPDERISPRFEYVVLWFIVIYCGLTLAEILMLHFMPKCNMPWFDAICYSMTTLSTGGFEPRFLGLQTYYLDSQHPAMDWVITFFMYLGGCNFVLHYRLITLKKRQYIHNSEWRFYTAMLLIAAVVIGFQMFNLGFSFTDTVRESLFMSVSMATTTGFASEDFATWGGAVPVVLCILMCICACGGSTSGGIKCERFQIVCKYVLYEIRHCLFPHQAIDIRIDKYRCDNSVIRKAIGFCVLYIILVFIFAVIIGTCEAGRGMDLDTTLSTSLACISNVGIGFGKIGPNGSFNDFQWWTKIILAMEMLIGRMELYTVLIMFLPSFWLRSKR